MITRKKKLCKCGCGKEGFIYAKGMLQWCYFRERANEKKNPIRKVSEKKKVEIGKGKAYYTMAMLRNIVKNKGVIKCDECGREIKKFTGRNVCHVVSFGANKAVYLYPENHFILGKGSWNEECECGPFFDESGKKEVMNIYPEYLRKLEIVNTRHLNESTSLPL